MRTFAPKQKPSHQPISSKARGQGFFRTESCGTLHPSLAAYDWKSSGYSGCYRPMLKISKRAWPLQHHLALGMISAKYPLTVERL